MSDSTLTIGVLLPDVLGTYSDAGNATVLAQRLRWRGIAAETVEVVCPAAERDDVELLPVAPLFPDVPGIARGDTGQLWPHRHGTDAMFLALLRRTG